MTARKREVICVACMAAVIFATCGFGQYTLSPTTPAMVADLGIDYELVGRLNAASSAGYMVFSFVAGFLCRFVSGRFLVTAALAVCGGSTFALTQVSAPFLLILFIFLLGCCAATAWIAMVDVIAEDVRPERRGLSVGIIMGGLAVENVLNGIVVPRILSAGSWRSVWLVCCLVTLLVFLAGMPLLWRCGENRRILQVSRGGMHREKLQRSGEKGPLRERILLTGLLLITGMTLAAFPYYIMAMLQEDLGLSARISGLGWSVMGGVGLVSGLFAGALADRCSAKAVLILTYTLNVLGLLLAHWAHWVPAMLLACALQGFAYNAAYVLHPVYVERVFPPHRVAVFFGLLNLCSGLGTTAANYAGGWLQSRTGSFSLTFLLMLLISVPGILICILLRSDRKNREKQAL